MILSTTFINKLLNYSESRRKDKKNNVKRIKHNFVVKSLFEEFKQKEVKSC